MDESIILYLLCFAGLADIVEMEIETHTISGKVIGKYNLRDHDLLIWRGKVNDSYVFNKFRTVEDIFLAIRSNSFNLKRASSITQKHLISVKVFRDKVLQAIYWKNVVSGKKTRKKSVRYASFIKQDIDHGPIRQAVTAMINRNFGAAFPNWLYGDPAHIECWGFWVHDELLTGIRLTERSFRSRQYRREERKASLRPSIAAAMALLSQPKSSDRVVDPMCGSGTLLIERGLCGAYKVLQGYDIDPHAVKLAEENSSRAGLKNSFFNCDDASSLPLTCQTVTSILCNMPFGKTYGARETNFRLYHNCLEEWSRVIVPNGLAVLLTSDKSNLLLVCKLLSNYWKVNHIYRFKVMGIWSSCFILQKL